MNYPRNTIPNGWKKGLAGVDRKTGAGGASLCFCRCADCCVALARAKAGIGAGIGGANIKTGHVTGPSRAKNGVQYAQYVQKANCSDYWKAPTTCPWPSRKSKFCHLTSSSDA